MLILGIETSCDETGLAILEATGGFEKPTFKLIAEALNSQTEIHKNFGGVFPMMAKREHSKNLIPLLRKLLEESGFGILNSQFSISNERREKLETVLSREPELLEQFLKFIPTIEKPPIDAIAVTCGPGLEPALWVGINFAKALSEFWQIPVIPVNHMEGHIFSVLLNRENEFSISNFQFPILALLISGGHTELVLAEDWLKYKIIGQTRDDAVGEAFDKVARILGLPYPGGPEISALAETSRSFKAHGSKLKAKSYPLPRPMLHSDNLDFSFSGLKTAVLYLVRKIKVMTPEIKASVAQEFEDSVTDVLVTKTRKALEGFPAQTLVLGGGVVANKEIRRAFGELVKDFPGTKLLISDLKFSTDNAVMIAAAGYFQCLVPSVNNQTTLKATGNLKLGSI